MLSFLYVCEQIKHAYIYSSLQYLKDYFIFIKLFNQLVNMNINILSFRFYLFILKIYSKQVEKRNVLWYAIM